MGPLLLHVPHASRVIPAEYRADFLLSDEELADELRLMTDAFTDELFAKEGIPMLAAPVSRLLVDMERFSSDELEEMSRVGMGMCYTRGSDMRPLRDRIPPARRQELLARYYTPHHEQLRELCAQSLADTGRCLIIDAHSFPRQALRYEEIVHGPCERPQICLGYEEAHCPAELLEVAKAFFLQKGYEVGLNTPFAGSLVPMDYYHRDARVHSLMVELRRDLYMDEATGQKHEGFAPLRANLQAFLNELTPVRPVSSRPETRGSFFRA